MRTFVYKLKPTAAQTEALIRQLDATRDLYNCALEHRLFCYRTFGVSVGRIEQEPELKAIRRMEGHEALGACHSHLAQTTLTRQHRAIERFFDACRAQRQWRASGCRGPRPRRVGYPRFKGARHWRSLQFKEWGNGIRLDPSGRLHVHGVGAIRLRLHRPLQGMPKTAALVRKADGWHVHVVCDLAVPPAVGSRTGPQVGLDLGVLTLAMPSDGAPPIENPRHLRRASRKLRNAQRRVSRCEKGSHRRRKAVVLLAKHHLHVARARRDYHHKQARLLADRYAVIAVEDLMVAAMTASGGRRKTGLNRAIADAGWGQFVGLIEEKLSANGGQFVRVPAHGTSQECSGCHERVPKALAVRVHDCPYCGLSLCRDRNAAVNIANRAGIGSVVEAV